MREIVPLPREEYEGYEIHFSYESEIYYDVRLRDTRQGFTVDFVRMPFPVPREKEFTDKLYEAYWKDAEAYGIFEEDALVGILEVAPETWNNRLRVTNLWVHEDYRRKGVGHDLLERAKQISAERGHRAVILETQSSNANAIAFYVSQGFTLGGFNTTEYSNEDVEKKEVRMEMVYKPSRVNPY